MATQATAQSPFASRPSAKPGKSSSVIRVVIGALLGLATLAVAGLGGLLYLLAGSAPQECSISGSTAATLIACYLLARAGEMITSGAGD